MNALEILLGRRWILKSRDRELYYQVKDQLGAVKRFLTEKLGYQVIVNPYLIKAEKMPAKPENWMGILEFHHKIEYVFFCIVLMFLEEKEAEEQFVLSSERNASWPVRYAVQISAYPAPSWRPVSPIFPA